MRVRIPLLPLGSIVKRKSCLASNEVFQVRILVEPLVRACLPKITRPCGEVVSHLALNETSLVRFPVRPLLEVSHVLGVCRIRTRPCEGRRPGSIPGEGIFRSAKESSESATDQTQMKHGSESGRQKARALIRVSFSLRIGRLRSRTPPTRSLKPDVLDLEPAALLAEDISLLRRC